ncbi:MAG TPA: response regulator [Chloroflexia bacterium]|nr:response regulator [Chloroflexia bacterium]
MPKRIMVVNDTQEILELFEQILRGEGGYEVDLCSYSPEMLEHVKEYNPDLIISDHVFGEEKLGWQFVQRLHMDRETSQIPVIVCTGAVKEVREMEGYLTQKGVGLLFKPFDVDELLSLVASKLEGTAGESERESAKKKQ